MVARLLGGRGVWWQGCVIIRVRGGRSAWWQGCVVHDRGVLWERCVVHDRAAYVVAGVPGGIGAW